MKAKLMGIHKVNKRLSDGSIGVYYYAWRGGPRIKSNPDTREFLAEFVHLTHDRSDAVKTGTLAELIEDFKKSSDFTNLAERTQQDYHGHFPHILAKFADMQISWLEERGFRAAVKDWQEGMASAPRRADMRLSAFKRIISFAVDKEILTVNKLAGIKNIHSGTRRDEIWTGEQLDTFVSQAPVQLARAVMLALWTGQRPDDVLSLLWSNYDGNIISLKQKKTGKRVRVTASEELKEMLDTMPRTAVNILTTGAGIPWGSGFGGYFRKWQKKLEITGVTFNDLRGTFVTVSYAKGYSIKDIAKATGHEERFCERIINDHYLAADLTLNVNEYRTKM